MASARSGGPKMSEVQQPVVGPAEIAIPNQVPCMICGFGVRAETFWNRVLKTDSCWLWQGSKVWGYGLQCHMRANRLAWWFTHGPIPKGMEVCHNCPGGDNRACCNPSHLWLGTHAQNMRDMAVKGRSFSKLTAQQAQEIRGRRAAGEKGVALAKEFGVTESAVCSIHRGRNWKWGRP
jgi:hypothetical protein